MERRGCRGGPALLTSLDLRVMIVLKFVTQKDHYYLAIV